MPVQTLIGGQLKVIGDSKYLGRLIVAEVNLEQITPRIAQASAALMNLDDNISYFSKKPEYVAAIHNVLHGGCET